MVNLEKRVAKVESTTDTEFEAFIVEMDDFIQEMREENRLYAEIHKLYKKNQMLDDENQALKEELRRQKAISSVEIAELRQQNKKLVEEIQELIATKNNVDNSKNKNESDIKFERHLKTFDILMYILWGEIGLLIGLDIVIWLHNLSN